MTDYQALEAMLFSRQATRDEANYKQELLVKWFSKNIPLMRPLRKKSQMDRSISRNFDTLSGSQGHQGFNSVGRSSRNNFPQLAKSSHLHQDHSRNPSLAAAPLDLSRRTIYADHKFRVQLETTVESITRIPKLQANVLQKVSHWQIEKESQAAQAGLRGALRARENLKLYSQREEKDKQDLLQKFIQHEPHAFNASNLLNLLTRKWSEEPNAYKIKSQITPKKQKRIKFLCLEDRYNS